MRVFGSIVIAFGMLAGEMVVPATSQEQGSKISRVQVEQVFNQLRARTPWNIEGPLTWGFFFTSFSKKSLEDAAKLLDQKGYRFVEIRPNERRSQTDPEFWWLHVERFEIHTVDSLDKRNQELYTFAQSQNLRSYDGMDVGPAP
jgi:hypothetical protein